MRWLGLTELMASSKWPDVPCNAVLSLATFAAVLSQDRHTEQQNGSFATVAAPPRCKDSNCILANCTPRWRLLMIFEKSFPSKGRLKGTLELA